MASGICSISYLSKIENSIVDASDEIIELFCKKLSITLDQLEGESERIPKLRLDCIDLYKLIRKKNVDTAHSKYQQMINDYKSLTSPQAQLIKSLFGLRVALMMNDHQKASQFFNEVIELKDYQPDWIKTYYYRFCGLFHYMFGGLEQSLQNYKEAEKHISIAEQEEVFYQLALVYSRLEQVSLSTFYLTKALDIFLQKMDYDLCTNCKLLLGINYRKMREFEKSKENYLSILDSFTPHSDKQIIAKVYHNLGLTFADEGDTEQAITCFEEGLYYRQEEHTRIITMHLLTKEYVKRKDWKNALHWFQEGKVLAECYNQTEYTIKFSVLEFYIQQLESTPEFEQYMNDIAIPYFEERGEKQTVNELIYQLASYYEEKKQYKNAVSLLKKLI